MEVCDFLELYSWKELISAELKKQHETWGDIISSTLSEEELDFDLYERHLDSFTLWSKKRVYFPIYYDGYYSVGSVSRKPDGKASGSFGGG